MHNNLALAATMVRKYSAAVVKYQPFLFLLNQICKGGSSRERIATFFVVW